MGLWDGTMSEDVVTVEVELPGRAYPIDIGPGALGRIGERLRGRCEAGRATLITDANVGPLYGEKAASSLDEAGFEVVVLTEPAADASKSTARAGLL